MYIGSEVSVHKVHFTFALLVVIGLKSKQG